ncbi:MAG: hypothetical protein AAB390_03050 [Patescibacteria group bacterium]
MKGERTIGKGEDDRKKEKEKENAELIRLVYCVEKIKSLLPTAMIEKTTALKCTVTDTPERLKLALKTISQMFIIDSLYGGMSGIDDNGTWDRWGVEGYSELFGNFYIAKYSDILETPERVAELFKIYKHENSDLPPFRSTREPVNSEV